MNDGKGRFSPQRLSGCGPLVLRASAAADLDGDGDLDIVALGVEGPVRVFRNDAPRGGSAHWLRVRLQDQGGNRDALGATLVAVAGAKRWSAEIRTAAGFQAACPAEAHFGLGAAQQLDELRVRWPDGAEQTWKDVAADRVLVLTRETSK